MDSPGSLLERLLAIPGYEWDLNSPPYHSSYDNWHYFGTKIDTNVQVFARVSKHVLRIEREFQLCKQILNQNEHSRICFVTPIELIKVAPPRNDTEGLAISICEAPSPNYLQNLEAIRASQHHVSPDDDKPKRQIPLVQFLDFAVGAAKCLEILHHENRLVHGEIRGDAFHFDQQTGRVRMINFGSGARSFENGLTSAGWHTLSRQVGIAQKLRYIAPEQTGRLPAQPDGRTDIYSLGILFWSMLTGEIPFDGSTPLAVMQNVLSRRIPYVSSKRLDVPDCLAAAIAKMTQRNIDNRYNSIVGLKYDIISIRQILHDGSNELLKTFEIATKDVSSYFNLPSHQIGRKGERDQIIQIMSNFCQKQLSAQASRKTRVTQPKIDLNSIDETSDNTAGGSQKNPTISLEVDASTHNSQENGESLSLVVDNLSIRQIDTNQRPLSVTADTLSMTSESILNNHDSVATDTSLENFRSSRRRAISYTQVVSISGSAGSGKSNMLQSLQSFARTQGYFASAKFDQTKKIPFEPMLQIISSLFRQIFSESNVSTPFHNKLRQHVGPVWTQLHQYLNLPIWLLDNVLKGGISFEPQKSKTRRDSTSSLQSKTSSSTNISSQITPIQRTGNIAADWIKTGGTAKASRFSNIIIGALQVIASMKFVCLGADDIQFADQESLELISNIIEQKISLFLVLTSRDDGSLSQQGMKLITKSIKIDIKPFSDNDTIEYVCATIHRDRDYVLPLVSVVQEKSGGNPFFIREILETCYRKGCIYYSWPKSSWEYDLDKVFSELVSDGYGTRINNDFVTKRLQELSPDARTLLSWASIIGESWSFSMIKDLMDVMSTDPSINQAIARSSSRNAILGLQQSLNAFIIMTADDDDRFRFAHDRYLQAAASLMSGDEKFEMEFTISTAFFNPKFIESTWMNSLDIHQKVQHITQALELIKERIPEPYLFRRLLYDAAENAFDSGARAVASDCLSHCVYLLQDNPWDTSAPDVSYQETLKIYIKAAENYWYQSNFQEAMELVKSVYNNAKSVPDIAPCWIIESRIYARQGDNIRGFEILKKALASLGLKVPSLTLEECDAEFYRMLPEVETIEKERLSKKETSDANMQIIGVILAELSSTAFWSSLVLYYQASLLMIRIHLDKGPYPQCGLGYLQIATVIIHRLGLVDFGTQLAEFSRSLIHVFGDDFYTIGRGLTLHTFFMHNLTTKLTWPIDQLTESWSASMSAGDRIIALLNFGVRAYFRIWSSQDLAETEAFIQDAGSEFFDWIVDMRGGVFLVSARQFVRALQGKTDYYNPNTIFDDHQHNDSDYLELINSKCSSPDRQKTLYWTAKHICLYLFGHYQEAMELGEILAVICEPWVCSRFTYDNLFFVCLSYCSYIRMRPSFPDRQIKMDQIAAYKKIIARNFSVNDVNYRCQLLLIDAEVSDVMGDTQMAMTCYEDALDHCQHHDNSLVEGLILELYARAMIRIGSRRSAKRLLRDCKNAYRRISADGKVSQIDETYSALLSQQSMNGSTDAVVQTDIIIDTSSIGHFKLIEAQNQTADNMSGLGIVNSLERTATRETLSNRETDFSAMGLDMIDLTSILESSQLLSSELKIDKLMGKLVDIITEISTADLVGIVIKDEQKEWVLSAVGTPDGTITYPEGRDIHAQDADQILAHQVTVYVLRSKETVFVPNLLEDDRFSGVSQLYLDRNPLGKAVIALPILHGGNDLLGVICVEGPPAKFTERTLSVLKLLVNQISISLSNALVLKKVEKVSAENLAMIGAQRRALGRAREAETKAKEAESEAIKNMHEKEEAARAKSMFLANVSHELRTPLTGVIGMSELLKGTDLSAKQLEFADSIRMCADTLLSLINDLLDYTKLDAGKMKLDLKPVNLSKNIQEIIRALSYYQNNEKGLKTIQNLELDADEIVVGDPVRLHQVLMNLLSNSYKFTHKGTVTVTATCVAESKDTRTVTVTVADTGIGIPEEQCKKLFQPFTQVESTSSRTFQGTGLGLSICKRLVENLMGGKIWLESTLGVGTTVGFTIEFMKAHMLENISTVNSNGSSSTITSPTRRSISHANGDSTTSVNTVTTTGTGVSSSGSSTSTPKKMGRDQDEVVYSNAIISSSKPFFRAIHKIPRDEIRVAIAEDNPINQKIAISYVQKLGFKCEAYSDGRKAVDALQAAGQQGVPYHIVLMDCQMPHLDGYDATREIRRSAEPLVRDVLIIAMTASAIQGDREKCLNAGMNDYLSKPVRQATLKALIESYLDPSKEPPKLDYPYPV